MAQRFFRALGLFFLYLLSLSLTLWACAALYFDLSGHGLHILLTAVYILVVLALAIRVRTHFHRFLICAALFGLVLAAWLSLKPTNNHHWQEDVSQTAWAEVNGDTVTIHNFRYCHYQAEFSYSCEWLTKTVNLSDLRGIDIAITYWGSPYIAHPIVSFWFGDSDYIAASIETRKRIGQGYSAIRGFFRQYELIYLFSDESDIIRLRTNFRKGEEVYLYRTIAGPEWSRELFLEYIRQANLLRDHPQWYNALTRNCTTVIFQAMAEIGRLPNGTSRFDWRILLNGLSDKMLYDGGNFASQLPFPELKQAVHINDAAQSADDSGNFSRLIRLDRPGFEYLQ
jgi:Domain of unknown function (DUF4105)